ncbi:MAG: hypothetical protein NZM43_13360, partial [Saprospiraceae bacterium]|nr:hypothetical protein [Saprospiraceae bacterium]MDW8485303.1 hypothetical protein [Saprospiraceae bacterium]
KHPFPAFLLGFLFMIFYFWGAEDAFEGSGVKKADKNFLPRFLEPVADYLAYALWSDFVGKDDYFSEFFDLPAALPTGIYAAEVLFADGYRAVRKGAVVW